MSERGHTRGDNEDPFEVIAGAPCLDFTNTVGGRRRSQTDEHLHTFADLVHWSRQAGLLAADMADGLIREAERHRDEASAVLVRAVALREALYGIFTALLSDIEPSPADAAILNGELSRALARMALHHTRGEGFAWRWIDDEQALDRVLWDVARSAADLLVSPTVHLVRKCASDACGWLFIDATRNHSRRWCDMRGCGNRAKVRRHRSRRRAASEE
jgi:predicted RNA-binding Zn ribbon-like protein